MEWINALVWIGVGVIMWYQPQWLTFPTITFEDSREGENR